MVPLGVRKPGNLQEAARIIREIARDGGRINIIKHARDEMSNDQVNALDVRHALRGCSVIRAEMHGYDWRYTCLGLTRDEERIGIAVKICQNSRKGAEKEVALYVITVYRNQQ
jgi:hypothetical protein